MLFVFEQSHLKQVEDDYKRKLEKELSARKEVEKVFYSSPTRLNVLFLFVLLHC